MVKRYNDVAHPSSGYGSGFFEWIHILFVALVVAGLVSCFFNIINVKYTSMVPTVNDGDKVILNRAAYWFSPPKHGDVIIFYESSSDSNYVKRIIGLPGDTIEIEDGILLRNGKFIDEPYILAASDDNISITVPEGTYFCMGDNRAESIDSRDESIGCIAEKNILGKVIYSLAPLKPIE